MPKTSPLSDYGWNERAGRYVNLDTGRFVPRASIKAELEKIVAKSQSDIYAFSQRLQQGQITLGEWQLAMRDSIKAAHVASAASARGGWAQMTQSDWGATGNLIKQQYAYLNNFAAQVEKGLKLDGRFVNRATMYGEAPRGTYEAMKTRYETVYQGAVEERRVLSIGAEHCESSGDKPGCVELAERGWQPIGTLPRIGEATCITHCQCVFETRDADGNIL